LEIRECCLIQWLFLGDLRSAIIVSANIPFALFFAIVLLVIRGEDANLLSLGAVDLRRPSNTMRIFSSAENCRRVARRMSFTTFSADSFTGARISVSSSLLARLR
jgi:hypothetical protein